MFLFSQRKPISAFFRAVLSAIISLSSSRAARAQSLNGVNNTGTYGNETVEGTIHFPGGQKSGFQPIIKLHSDTSSGELTALPNADGAFSFTRLRPDSYTLVVNGGDEFENARETVAIGNSGPVPGQGNPNQYAHPLVYQVDIYLQPKRAKGLNANVEGTKAMLAKLPQPARDLFTKGMELARTGEAAKAIGKFREAISHAPDFAPAYNEMGRQYLKLAKAEKAAESFAEAVRISPDDFEAHLNYGFALLNLKKFSQAEDQLRQALQKNPASGSGHYYLALALMNQQQFAAAEAEFKTAILKTNDGIAATHKYLGGIYWHEKQNAPAVAELEKYLALEPNAPDAARIRDTIKELRAK